MISTITLKTSAGIPLRTQEGSLLLVGDLLPLVLLPAPPDPQATRVPEIAYSRGLKTAGGAPIFTRVGAPLVWALPLVPPFLPAPPDPQATRVPEIAYSRGLKTAGGAPIFTGVGVALVSQRPLPPRNLYISGVTRDSNRAPLAGCVVQIFRTVDDVLVDRVISDANGNYFSGVASPSQTYYIVAYLAGSPDVAGTTVNTLVGT